MNRAVLWFTTVMFGAATLAMTTLGLPATLLFLLLFVPFLVRGDPLVALSGLLTGFGGLLTFDVARNFSVEVLLDNPWVWAWIIVGVVPLVTGCALLAVACGRAIKRSSAAQRA